MQLFDFQPGDGTCYTVLFGHLPATSPFIEPVMPSFRKLSPAETAANVPTRSARAQIAQAYDTLLVDFALGDYGRAELHEGERRDTVRRQL